MQRNTITILALTLLIGWAQPRILLAQHEWDNFAIGQCLIVNLGDTVPKFDTSPEQISGLAYTCLVQGGQLILTDPTTGQIQYIAGYNRNFEPMSGVEGISGAGGLACPVPGDDSAWFTIGKNYTDAGFTKIDMRGDGGLGEVTTKQDFAWYQNYGGSAVVPATDNYHYWLIAPGPFAKNANGQNVITELYSYLIGPDGPILPPVISKVPVDLGDFMYGSPDGSTLAVAAEFDSLENQYSGIGIFHVNTMTGEVTFIHELQEGNFGSCYGDFPYTFSPDSKVFYRTVLDCRDSISAILQYDLRSISVNDAPYIVAESKDTNYHAFGTDIALAGNGRIYGTSDYWRFDKKHFAIGYYYSINSPDSLGSACHFEDTAFSSGTTEGAALWNGVPRVVHSRLAQISTVSLPDCQSSAYSFSRPDTGGFPHWTFVGGTPATAMGSIVPQVTFDSAGPHDVFAVTSTGDTLFDLVAAGVSSGAAYSLANLSSTVQPGEAYTLPVQLKLDYANGGPSNTGDTIGHLMQEYVIQFDSSILSLPADLSTVISLPQQDELYSARQTGGTLILVIEDTIGSSWMVPFGTPSWRDTMDNISIRFSVTKSNNWQSSKVTLGRFSLDDGFGTRYDFCPEENDLLATITNSQAGVAQPSAVSNITIYPNPTTGMVTITGASGAVEVENILGKRISIPGSIVGDARTTVTGTRMLDLSRLPSGTYFVRVIGQNGQATMRRVVRE